MSAPVFVSGATGTQGGAVASHLRKANIPVHALVRDPSSTKAKDLQALGVTLFQGSFEDDAALTAALKGTQSAFLNFLPNIADITTELQQANTVLSAARAAGLKHVVYASSLSVDENSADANEDASGVVARIIQQKGAIVRAVISAGFESHTILRAGKFMSDLYGPAAAWFGDLSKTGTIETALREGEPGPWVDVDDVGAFGAAALLDPERLGGKSVDVFTEWLTIDGVIGMLVEVTGKKLGVRFVSEGEVEERIKGGDVFMEGQALMRDMGSNFSLEEVKAWGVPVGSFRGFLERERAQILQTYAHLPDAE